MQSWTSVKLWNVNVTIHDGLFVCTIDRFGGKGAQIIGNHFTNGAALLGRTKSSSAVIRGNTWTDTGEDSFVRSRFNIPFRTCTLT